MNLTETVEMFRKIAKRNQDQGNTERAEVFNAVARMLDTVAGDIVIEEHEAKSHAIKTAWSDAAGYLSIK